MSVKVKTVRFAAWAWLTLALLHLPLVAYSKYVRHRPESTQLFLQAALVFACGAAFNFTVGYLLKPRQQS